MKYLTLLVLCALFAGLRAEYQVYGDDKIGSEGSDGVRSVYNEKPEETDEEGYDGEDGTEFDDEEESLDGDDDNSEDDDEDDDYPKKPGKPWDRKPWDRKPWGRKPWGRRPWGRKPWVRKSWGRHRPHPRPGPWPKMKCMIGFFKCLKTSNHTCDGLVGCYAARMKCFKKMHPKPRPELPAMEKKCPCKTGFQRCMKEAGDNCEHKFFCYKSASLCWKMRKGRRPGPHHHRHHRHRHHHHHRPRPFMKCMEEKFMCMRKALWSCNATVTCKDDFMACMKKLRPTTPPPTTQPPTAQPNDDVVVGHQERLEHHHHRWNPKKMKKCMAEFKNCTAAAEGICVDKFMCYSKLKCCAMRSAFRNVENMSNGIIQRVGMAVKKTIGKIFNMKKKIMSWKFGKHRRNFPMKMKMGMKMKRGKRPGLFGRLG